MFGRKNTEEERIKENSRADPRYFRTRRRHRTRFDEDSTRSNEGDLICEEEIMKDKERFGRARKSKMNSLRAKYGEDVANRALWRVNRRKSEGYFKTNTKSDKSLEKNPAQGNASIY